MDQDGAGHPFAPSGRYELHFGADALPPVNALWSLAVDTAADLKLIPNPLDGYSLGDHGGDLARDADGSLTAHLQPDAPDGGVVGNWLPTSGTQPWFLILRIYRPRPTVLDVTWRCPAVDRVDMDPEAATA